MAISGLPSGSVNKRVNLYLIVLRASERRAKEFWQKALGCAAEEEEEMAKYLGPSLRKDEFFDRGFHQLH
jgi:hypothetical protein